MPINPNIIMQAGRPSVPLKQRDPMRDAMSVLQVKSSVQRNNALKEQNERAAQKRDAEEGYKRLSMATPENYAQYRNSEIAREPEAAQYLPEQWDEERIEQLKQTIGDSLLDPGQRATLGLGRKRLDVTREHNAATLDATKSQREQAQRNWDRNYSASRSDAASTAAHRAKVLAAQTSPLPKASDVAGLRKEFFKASGDYIKLRDAYSKIEISARNPSPAGDMALIFNFMKMLDPGSTVREGEYASAKQATNVPGQVRNLYNAAVEGTKLNPTQRADFVGKSKAIFDTQARSHEKTKRQFKSVAERLSIPAEDVVFDFSADEVKVLEAPPSDGTITDPNDRAELEELRARKAAREAAGAGQ